jgi:hypothetical protein
VRRFAGAFPVVFNDPSVKHWHFRAVVLFLAIPMTIKGAVFDADGMIAEPDFEVAKVEAFLGHDIPARRTAAESK